MSDVTKVIIGALEGGKEKFPHQYNISTIYFGGFEGKTAEH